MGMQKAIKQVLFHALPVAVCGAATTAADGERIQWAEADRSQPAVVQAIPALHDRSPPAPVVPAPGPDFVSINISGTRN